MKHYLAILVLGAFALTIFISSTSKQVHNPVQWKYKLANPNVKAGEETEIIFYATIEKDWYLYSSDFSKDAGPTVATFDFTTNPDNSYKLIGGIKAINPTWKFDEVWGAKISFFNSKAEFRQKVKVLKNSYAIAGEISYQSCQDMGRCVSGIDEFILTAPKSKPLKKPSAPAATGTKTKRVTAPK